MPVREESQEFLQYVEVEHMQKLWLDGAALTVNARNLATDFMSIVAGTGLRSG
jgi:hypothetical protein